jgi:hypothetical protein
VLNEWNHIALVVEPNQATLYLNGIPSIFLTSHSDEAFDSPLVLGSDPGWGDRFFKGDMDEVCFYAKPLTQNQIREEMHLTRTHTDTTALRSYLQFNEADGPAFDRTGLGFASFGGDAHRVVSTVAVGPGVSNRKTVTNGGAVTFGATGVTATFPSGGNSPDGELCVTRLDIAPDQSPAADSISRSYWVLHNFAANPYFDELEAIRFDQIGNVPSGSVAQQYQLYARAPRGEGDTWQSLDAADALTPGADGSVVFSDGNGVGEPHQFVISRPIASATQEPTKGQLMVNVSPNPVASNGILNISTNLTGKVKFKLFDEKGRAVRLLSFEREGQLALNGLAAGAYSYSVESERVIRFGQVVVQ